MGNKSTKERRYSKKDITRRDAKGRTMLIRAVSGFTGYERIVRVKELISRGADINAQDDEGTTALMWACTHIVYRGLGCVFVDPNIVKLLLQSGADANIKDRRGRGVLLRISQGGRVPAEAVQALIQAGADTSERDVQGNTVLMNVIDNPEEVDDTSRYETIEALVEAGIDLSVRNDDGYTSLMLAVKHYYRPRGYDIVEILLKKGAEADLLDCFGDNVLWQFPKVPKRLATLLGVAKK